MEVTVSPIFLPRAPDKESTDRVRLAVGVLMSSLQDGAPGALQELEELGGLTPLDGTPVAFLRDLADLAPLVAFSPR